MDSTTPMTPTDINDTCQTKFHSDPDQRAFWAEWMRAQFCLIVTGGQDPMGTLKSYNVTADVIQHILGEAPPAPEPKQKRSDKYQNIIDWCMDNHLYQTDANEVADIGGVSYATAIKFIKDRPDLFFRIKKGVYEVRNPKIVREEEGS